MNTEQFIQKSLMPRFTLGTVAVTQGFVEAYGSFEIVETRALELIGRHAVGDWGEVCDEDVGKNNIEATRKGMLMSAYTIATAAGDSLKVWVITDPGHESTTILLPSEY